jgi:hypothetical protein
VLEAYLAKLLGRDDNAIYANLRVLRFSNLPPISPLDEIKCDGWYINTRYCYNLWYV